MKSPYGWKTKSPAAWKSQEPPGNIQRCKGTDLFPFHQIFLEIISQKPVDEPWFVRQRLHVRHKVVVNRKADNLRCAPRVRATLVLLFFHLVNRVNFDCFSFQGVFGSQAVSCSTPMPKTSQKRYKSYMLISSLVRLYIRLTARTAFCVICLCHDWLLGDHLNALLFNIAISSLPGLSACRMRMRSSV